ncbi:MAG: hypothetical protein HC844_10275 [Tabrizicola sp.]|nr:hypothetical protein [Tabrizicola sp.]
MRLPLATLALVSFASYTPAQTSTDLPTITLKGGEAWTIPDTDVTLMMTKVDDHRCWFHIVKCTWDPGVRIEISIVRPSSQPDQIVLCNQCEDATTAAIAAGFSIGYVGISPSTEALDKLDRPAELADYELTVSYAPAGN